MLSGPYPGGRRARRTTAAYGPTDVLALAAHLVREASIDAGVAVGLADVAAITVGTGIGGALLVDGHVCAGARARRATSAMFRPPRPETAVVHAVAVDIWRRSPRGQP